MIKKKLSILLLLSLAVLFIGLFSTTYARSLSANEIRNAIKNCYQNRINQTISSNHLNNINNVDLSGWVDVISRYQGKYIITFQVFNGRILTNLFCYSGSKLNLTTQNGQNAIQTVGGTLFSSQFDCSDSSVSAWNNTATQQFPYTWAYFESGIYQNSNTYFIEPYSYIPNINIFNSSYGTDIFRFVRNTNLQTIHDNNIAVVTSGDTLGYVELGQNYGAVEVSCNYWDKVRNSWVEFYWFAVANTNNASQVNIYIRDLINSSNNNIFPNVLVQTTYHSNDTDKFDTDYMQPFIITDSHTVITNDEFDPDNTFDDDSYYNDYMNTINSIKDNDNTDKITDTLTDDSQVDSMLSEFISGDANDLANRLGYSGIENPFVATIKNVVESTADVLLGSGNVTLDISFYGQQIILHSEDFVLPSNPVVTLIHLICNGFFIWGLYKYGFKLYQYINTGRIKKVIDETDSDKYYFF